MAYLALWVLIPGKAPAADTRPNVLIIITDDQGFRYVVSSPESTDLGWRITAMMAIA